MKKILILTFLLPILFIDFGCKEGSTEPVQKDTTTVIIRKPNLYIYPQNTFNLALDIDFPKGGNVIESDPNYNDWDDLIVESSGRINGKYDYLFYECELPKFAQKEFGWIIQKQNLEEFFRNNLLLTGFSEKEIDDFLEYWIPILKSYNYYEIYPQYTELLNKIIKLNFSVEPDHLYRLCYFIIGRDHNDLILKPPSIQTATRSEYFAVEWGVIFE